MINCHANDDLALKSVDTSATMGKEYTDVTHEESEIILTGDSFATITTTQENNWDDLREVLLIIFIINNF